MNADEDHDLASIVFETTSDLMILLDSDGVVLRSSRAIEGLTGSARDELQGRSYRDISFLSGLDLPPVHDGQPTSGSLLQDRSQETEGLSRAGRRFRIRWRIERTRTQAGPGDLLLIGKALDGPDAEFALLSMKYAILEVLSKGMPEVDAARESLRIIVTSLGAEIGEYWTLEETGTALKLAASWNSPHPKLANFSDPSREKPLDSPTGLIARLWKGEPAASWFEDFSDDSEVEFDRKALACGLRTGHGFPIKEEDRIIGVMLFYTRSQFHPEPNYFGTIKELGGIFGTVYARGRAKAELLRSEARKSAILSASLDAIITIDQEGKILEFNSAAERTFGHSWKSVIGRSLAEIIVPPAYRERHYEGIRVYLKTGVGPALNRRIELPALRASGEIFPSEISIVPTILDGKQLFTGYIRDITEKKRGEEEMRLAKEAAEAGSRAKSVFLANMSHELRTPLTAILGSSDMLSDLDLGSSHSFDVVKLIRRNGEHLLRIIDNILELSKIDAEQAPPEIRSFAPWPQLAEVVSALNVQAREKNLELNARVLGILPSRVRSDAIRVGQILKQLLSNAIKFTSTGRIEIVMRFEKSEQPEAYRLCYDIIDNGVGMTPEQVECLFTPFYQVDSSMTRAVGGTGLGLFISRKLAESLGGTIEVESEIGKGSRFTFRVPLTIDPDAEMLDPGSFTIAIVHTPVSIQANAISKMSGHVLVVEDSRDNQRVLNYHLVRQGLTIDIAENGREAVELGTTRSYDLILMDIQMPELDGYAATRLLRRAGFTKPILALTAHAMAGDAERCIAAGCDDYLRKPIEIDRLVKSLRRHLGQENPAPSIGNLLASVDLEGEEAPIGEPIRSDFADDADFMDLVREYVRGLPQQVEAFRDRLDRGLLSELSRLAHTLSGSGGMYGYDTLSAAAAEIEQAILKGEAPRLAELVQEVETITKRIQAGLSSSDSFDHSTRMP